MRSALRFGLVAVAALSLAACESGAVKTAAVTKVASTTSFGMCAGYCKTTLEITANEAVLTREAWGRGAASGLPTQRFNAALSAQEWDDIAAAAAAAKIDGLPERIGCPDCADGGAESLTIVGAKGTKTITFDHGAAVAEAQPLIERVRALRARMMPKEQ
ncbi:MAG: hypothetical protein HOP13_04875 [Alphaproteobacteria bacterium]|nr:hypothetical protein [Alphaproteobacteria bacterium]